jgi:acetyltransferase
MLVSDEYQGQGIGKELLRRLIQIARDEKVKHLRATLSPDNASMRKVCEKLGFSSFYTNSKTGMVEAEMQL